MVRPVTIIVAAIQALSPQVSDSNARAYAEQIRVMAIEHSYDPFTAIALIHHESNFRANAVSRDLEDIGLAQIRARYRGGCRNDPDPAKNPSRACIKTRMALMNPLYNIRAMSNHITKWRQFCRKKTKKRALLRRWLAGYGGYSRLPNKVCNMKRTRRGWRDLQTPKGVREIVALRLRLLRRLRNRRSARKSATTSN